MHVFNIKISKFSSYQEVYLKLLDFIRTTSNPVYITVNNVHTFVEGVRNESYKEILNNSFLSLPDGKPLSIVANLKGADNISRIFGPSFMENTINWGQNDKIRHFFFGSSDATITKMIDSIKEKYPNAIISGFISPPYRTFTKIENERFIEEMNLSNADIFWIGLGAPKQERWMSENYKKLNKGVMVGIGAGFDYLAGTTKHAPEWMKNMALEWLFRLIQEPKRLWKRYLVTNTLFLYYLLLEFTGLKKFD